MSVPAYRRNTSKIEFLNTFNKIRIETIKILMRDFGIKPRHYTVHLLEEIYDIDGEDKEVFEDLMEKYKINTAAVDKYPEWLVNSYRDQIMDLLYHIAMEIELANSIYITNLNEYYARRGHWTNAIGYLVVLKDKLHEIISIFTVKKKAYVNVFTEIDLELRLLKSVRKSDNRIYRSLLENNMIYFPTVNYLPQGSLGIIPTAPALRPEALQKAKALEKFKGEMCTIVNKVN